MDFSYWFEPSKPTTTASQTTSSQKPASTTISHSIHSSVSPTSSKSHNYTTTSTTATSKPTSSLSYSSPISSHLGAAHNSFVPPKPEPQIAVTQDHYFTKYGSRYLTSSTTSTTQPFPDGDRSEPPALRSSTINSLNCHDGVVPEASRRRSVRMDNGGAHEPVLRHNPSSAIFATPLCTTVSPEPPHPVATRWRRDIASSTKPSSGVPTTTQTPARHDTQPDYVSGEQDTGYWRRPEPAVSHKPSSTISSTRPYPISHYSPPFSRNPSSTRPTTNTNISINHPTSISTTSSTSTHARDLPHQPFSGRTVDTRNDFWRPVPVVARNPPHTGKHSRGKHKKHSQPSKPKIQNTLLQNQNPVNVYSILSYAEPDDAVPDGIY